jgi:hypothetical protein
LPNIRSEKTQMHRSPDDIDRQEKAANTADGGTGVREAFLIKAPCQQSG